MRSELKTNKVSTEILDCISKKGDAAISIRAFDTTVGFWVHKDPKYPVGMASDDNGAYIFAYPDKESKEKGYMLPLCLTNKGLQIPTKNGSSVLLTFEKLEKLAAFIDTLPDSVG